MKTVIVTGAGTGIGEATARLFSENNYRVILIGRKIEVLKKLSSQIKNAEAVACDLRDTKLTQKIAQKLTQDFQIDALINNAGIIYRENFDESADEHWMEQFQTNLFGAVALTREVYKQMQKNKQGSIINISSTLGLRPIPGVAAYSASKAAMVSWTETLAREGGAHNIRANCICPGVVDTPIHTDHKGELDVKSREFMDNLHLLKRMGKPSEIADAIWFLHNSEWTTGAILSVDGGIRLNS